jgi:hypothetical protein
MRRTQWAVVLVALFGTPSLTTAQPGPAQGGTAQVQQLAPLQRQVTVLLEEVAQLRARVEALERAQAGVGGAGGAGTAAPSPGERASNVAQAIFTGTVRDIRDDRIVLGDDGEPFSLRITPQTRAWHDEQPISVMDIPRGAQVEAAVDLVGSANAVSQLVVLR